MFCRIVDETIRIFDVSIHLRLMRVRIRNSILQNVWNIFALFQNYSNFLHTIYICIRFVVTLCNVYIVSSIVSAFITTIK